MRANISEPTSSDYLAASLVNWLFPAYVLMIMAGYFVLRSPGAAVAGNEITADRAIFTAVNAATLTGFQSSIPLEQYQPLAIATILGLMFGGILFTFIIGSLAVRRIAHLPWTAWQIIRASIFYTASASIIGTILLAPGRSVPDAIFLSVSSFGNCGLFTGHLPPIHDWQTNFVILPLAIAGSFGLPVLMELIALLTRKSGALSSKGFISPSPSTPEEGRGEGSSKNEITSNSKKALTLTLPRSTGRGDKLSKQSSTVLTWYACVYLVTLVLIFVFSSTTLGLRFGSIFSASSAISANSRTLGLPLAAVGNLTRAMQWILILSMAIGGAPASTAGGIKVTALAELTRGIRQCLRGQSPSRSFAIAAVWIGIYIAVVIAALLLLLTISPEVPADRELFHVVSAASNVGLSFDTIATVGNGLYVLTFTMFFGRVAAWLIVWWQADTATDEQIAVA